MFEFMVLGAAVFTGAWFGYWCGRTTVHDETLTAMKAPQVPLDMVLIRWERLNKYQHCLDPEKCTQWEIDHGNIHAWSGPLEVTNCRFYGDYGPDEIRALLDNQPTDSR